MANKASKIRRMPPDALVDLGAQVAERVQIQDVHLVETRARRGSVRKGQPLHLQFSVDVKTQVEEARSLVMVRPLLSLIAKYDETSDGEEAFRVEALFSLQYKINSAKGLSSTNYDAFGKTNGLYNAWPFWREYVQAMTARLGLPALTIPVLPPVSRAGRPSSAAPAREPGGGSKRKKVRQPVPRKKTLA